jgi:hypothetical protein
MDEWILTELDLFVLFRAWTQYIDGIEESDKNLDEYIQKANPGSKAIKNSRIQMEIITEILGAMEDSGKDVLVRTLPHRPTPTPLPTPSQE